jgi:3-oxo-5-alpha-steroid 4-dehydrogenase 1
MSIDTIHIIAYVWLAIAVTVHITMFYVTAPFGRHSSDKWGISIDNKLGWFVMELPSLGIMTWFLLCGTRSFDSYAWVLFGLWILHYANRTFVYPLRIKSTPKKMPLFIVANAILFNVMNAGLNGYYLAELAPVEAYSGAWFSSAHFMAGACLFATGMFINIKSDNILIGLRGPGESGYKIPQGFLFKYVSSPNLLGEIIEWSGFAMMAWNLPALTFMVWTWANLVPRAKNHHDWYLRNFPDYPAERKVVFPGIF